MKLIIKQYLSSLKERGELDSILPDLLSQMGMHLFSSPSIGPRQYGVDVGAVKGMKPGEKTVYLLSIKGGDLDRRSWDGNSDQSLRPSLHQICDVYIKNILPSEYKNEKIVICICLGGEIKEVIRESVTSHNKDIETSMRTVEIWDGDKIAGLILKYFLREELVTKKIQSSLRKSLALLEQPDSSYKHFANLLKAILNNGTSKKEDKLKNIRQINVCLWVIFSWARDNGNLEAAYLSSELALLYAWEIAKVFIKKKGIIAAKINEAFYSVFETYSKICSDFLGKIIPHAAQQHAISSAVLASSPIDINLKLFDILGRLAIYGHWIHWELAKHEDDKKEHLASKMENIILTIINLIKNNPVLLSPIKDEQCIDIFLACLLMIKSQENHSMIIKEWLQEIVNFSSFAFEMHGQYPCILTNYAELIRHPTFLDENYRKEVTAGSVLYPVIMIFAAMLNDDGLYQNIQSIKNNLLKHCNFQVWYPNENSEENFYLNEKTHGTALCHIRIEQSAKELLTQLFAESKQSNSFKNLSAAKSGLDPLILVACRHYRLPIPIDFLELNRGD